MNSKRPPAPDRAAFLSRLMLDIVDTNTGVVNVTAIETTICVSQLGTTFPRMARTPKQAQAG